MRKKMSIVVVLMLIVMSFGCKTIEKPKGAIPYIESGFNKEYALSQDELYEHDGEIVLLQIKF